MKLLKASIANFGSYRELEFNFHNQGLALVRGATGSGKSTLQDIPAWILYGITAKEGSVDEVKSWTAEGGPTVGALEVDLEGGTRIMVTRVRGAAQQNDLFWTESKSPDHKVRGKDLNDTQKLLEKRLGITADLYLTGSYFHEFSSTANFFKAGAKDRREVFDKIAEVDFATRLTEKSSEARKAAKKAAATADLVRSKAEGKYAQLSDSLEATLDDERAWSINQALLIDELQIRSANFTEEYETNRRAQKTKSNRWLEESLKKQDALILMLQDRETVEAEMSFLKNEQKILMDKVIGLKQADRCGECGALKSSKDIDLMKDGAARIGEAMAKKASKISHFDVLTEKLRHLVEERNPYEEDTAEPHNHYLEQIKNEQAKKNPFLAQVTRLEKEKNEALQQLTLLTQEAKSLESRYSSLTQLHDLSSTLRAELLRKAVRQIQDETNRRLIKYFNAEISVAFSLTDSDSLDVYLKKSGYDCSYTQLSKGQRQMLRLTFSVAIMQAAANKAGVAFDTLMFDESLDGLDTDLKIQAFGLFEELEKSHSSVLLIDHAPEFNNMFSKRYLVTLDQDESQIELEG